jgi:hypothetical protein
MSGAPAASATLVERFQAERAHVLQALDDKYRAEDEAHPEGWIMHSAVDDHDDTEKPLIDHTEMLMRIVAQGERPVLLELLTAMIRQGCDCFCPEATCVRPSPSFWLAPPVEKNHHASAEDVLEQAGRLEDAALRSLVEAYTSELRKGLALWVIRLVAQPVYAQWAAPAIAASPQLARFAKQLSDPVTYASLLTGRDDSEGKQERLLLASPLAEVTTFLSPQGYNDYNTHVFSYVSGRCFWVTLDRATFAIVLTDFAGLT